MKKFTSQEIKKFVSNPLFSEEVVLNKDSSWPKISIVTPSYNQSKFLERTILSVLNQNYPNLEYVIIDGGSTDGSVEIIKKYEKYFAYWISKKDKGQSDAINKGFQKSTGKILAWINSDDIYLPEALFKAAEAFKKNPEANFVFGNTYLIDECDWVIAEVRFTRFNFFTLIYEGGNLHQTGVFWTREIYNKAGGINPKYQYCMDFDFFCRIGKIGNSVRIRNFIAGFRQHKDSKGSTIPQVGLIEHKEIMKRYLPENISEFYLKHRRRLCQIRRFFLYMIQGDVDYIAKGIIKRLFKRKSFKK